MSFRMVTKRLANGRLTTILYNGRGIKVADLQDHTHTLEDLLIMARQLEEDHPELFDSETVLIPTAAEAEQQHAEEYGEGQLQPIPGR